MKITGKIPAGDKLFAAALFLITGTMLLILPSASVESLMNGTQSGKTILFIRLITDAGSILVLRLAFLPNPRPVKISVPDVILFAWIFYVSLNGWVKEVPVSLQLAEFYGLIFLYVVLRQTGQFYFLLLFPVLILGGGIQALYGNLQLWGFYPSHHGLFKMSGSFFNPGPYAGYLACIFPAVFGFYLFRIKPFLPGCKISVKDELKRIQPAFLSSLIHRAGSLFRDGKQPEVPMQKKQD